MKLRLTVRRQGRKIQDYEKEIQNYKVKDILGNPVPSSEGESRETAPGLSPETPKTASSDFSSQTPGGTG
jgi:hypothetical protein